MLCNAYAIASTPACLGSPAERSSEFASRQAPGQAFGRTADILAISHDPVLGSYLAGLFRGSGWTIARASTCAGGLSFLETARAAVAICEETLPDGDWRELAAALAACPDAPSLVVIGDRPALAPEVIELGGFDALVRPLRRPEVVWSVASAWHAWMKRNDRGHDGEMRCSGA